MRADAIAPYAPVIIRLLQGVIYSDDTATWNLLLSHRTAVQDHFARIGLELYLNEPDGFAFLRQPDLEDDAG